MAKLIDNILNARRATLTPADIEARIGQAEASVEQIRAEHRRAALEAEAGNPGSSERLADTMQRLHAAEGRISTLRSALIAAREDDELSRRRLQAKLRKENLAKITAAFERRDRAGERLSQAIADAAVAWRDLLESSEKAALPVPGMDYPAGAMTTVGELRRAVEHEFFRLGAVVLDHNRDLPGGKSPDFTVRDAPNQIKALPAVLKESSRLVSAILHGDQLEPA